MTGVDRLAQHAADVAREKAQKAAATIGIWAVAFALVCVALGFLSAAGYMALEQQVGHISAALIIGGGALILAAAFALVAASRHGTKDDAPASDPVPEQPKTADLPAVVGIGFLTGFLSGKPKK